MLQVRKLIHKEFYLAQGNSNRMTETRCKFTHSVFRAWALLNTPIYRQRWNYFHSTHTYWVPTVYWKLLIVVDLGQRHGKQDTHAHFCVMRCTFFWKQKIEIQVHSLWRFFIMMNVFCLFLIYLAGLWIPFLHSWWYAVFLCRPGRLDSVRKNSYSLASEDLGENDSAPSWASCVWTLSFSVFIYKALSARPPEVVVRIRWT